MCPRGCSATSALQIWNFIPTVEFHSSSKAVTANRNYSQPYVRCSPTPFLPPLCPTPRRSCDTHTSGRRPPTEFHFCKLFCHFLSSAIVSDELHCIPEHNELFRSALPLARPAPSSRSSRASPGRCIRRFIQRGTTN